jgi:hypothetical protein
MSNQAKTFQTVHEAYQLLQELGAPAKLILHVQLVAEAAELIISRLHQLGIQFDESFIQSNWLGKEINTRLMAKGCCSCMELIQNLLDAAVLMPNGKQWNAP